MSCQDNETEQFEKTGNKSIREDKTEKQEQQWQLKINKTKILNNQLLFICSLVYDLFEFWGWVGGGANSNIKNMT